LQINCTFFSLYKNWDIMNRGKLEFILSDKPNKQFGFESKDWILLKVQ
jgi:hypothetical protein